MPTEDDANFWNSLHEFLKGSLAILPKPVSPPTVTRFPYEGERWKEQAQHDQAEEDTWLDTQEIIRHFCSKREWPKKSKAAARYFVEVRIKWALRVTWLWTIPDSRTGSVFFSRPKQSGFELFEWLLIDAYEQRSPPSTKVPIIFSEADGTRRTHYT